MRILQISIILFTLFSCNTNQQGITLRQSTGRMNQLTVIMDNDLWQGAIGDSLRTIIASPVLGLPQEETQFNITQVPPKTFGELFSSTRNLLFINIDDDEGYGVKKNIYAEPQVAMSIFGKDKNSLLEQINLHKEEIISVFKEADLKLYQKKFTKDHWDTSKIKTFSRLNFQMSVPKEYVLVDDKGEFLWFRKNIQKGSMNIIAYQLPYFESDTIIKNIVEARNDTGKNHIPGQFEGTYMITEAAFSPFIKKTSLNKKPSYETRGTWEVKGDFMAGPFLNYSIFDKENNRVLVIEGFTYAPSVNKRDYMFELESILKTLKI